VLYEGDFIQLWMEIMGQSAEPVVYPGSFNEGNFIQQWVEIVRPIGRTGGVVWICQ